MKIVPKSMVKLIRKAEFLVLCFWALSSLARADSPRIHTPIVTTSTWGSVYFTMVPAQYQLDQKAFGRAYHLKENGESELLWEVSGWYSSNVYISESGEYLVRMGPWAVGSEPSEEDLAVAFYKQGKEIKRYSTKDLVKYSNTVERTVSHYFWLSEHTGNLKMDNNQKTFFIKTIDNEYYTFNFETGELVDK